MTAQEMTGISVCLLSISLLGCIVLNALTIGKVRGGIELLENRQKGRSEMTAFFKCNNCGRMIKDTRIHIGDDDQGESEFLYYFVGDDEGEEIDKHYCAKCLAFLLVGHGEQEEPEETIEGNENAEEGAEK